MQRKTDLESGNNALDCVQISTADVGLPQNLILSFLKLVVIWTMLMMMPSGAVCLSLEDTGSWFTEQGLSFRSRAEQMAVRRCGDSCIITKKD